MADDAAYRRRRGHWLRVARERKGWRLEDLARAMDYSVRSTSTFSRFEDGERDPSDVQLRHIAELLEVPVEVFTDPDETDHERLERRVAEITARRKRRDLRPA